MIAERESVTESDLSSLAELAATRLRLTDRSLVVELASTDGCLLQHFVKLGIPVLGVERDDSFFGVEAARRLSQQHGRADLIVATNVLSQVPDLNDFVSGIPLLLAWNGTLTLELGFPLYTTERIFAQHGLRVYDVEELPTHRGSLRVWGGHAADPRRETARLRELRARELADGVDQLDHYASIVAIPELEVSR